MVFEVIFYFTMFLVSAVVTFSATTFAGITIEAEEFEVKHVIVTYFFALAGFVATLIFFYKLSLFPA